VDLSGWRPDEAGIALALAKGATDIDAEVATFIACHERRGTRLERLDSRWRSWCERIVTFGPNGRRDAPRQPSPAPLRPLTVRQPVTIEVDALDGEAQDGTGQPSEGPAATTAVALPEPSAEAAGSADGRQTDADLAVARVAALWDLSKRPAGFAGELRDAFAGYPGPVLEQAINQVRAEVPYPITVADFTTRANALMAMPELFDPRRQQAKQREREADEAARCAAEAAAAVRAREQRERDAERKAGRILAGVAAEQRERVRLVALVWALAKPDYGTCLLAVHACAVMALAMHDPDAARELTYRGLAARNGHGDDPEFPALPDGLPDEPFRLFQAILKEN
jgi:hypothetical protein